MGPFFLFLSLLLFSQVLEVDRPLCRAMLESTQPSAAMTNIERRSARSTMTNPLQRLQPSRHLFGIGTAVKRRDPEISLALGAETASRRDHDIQFGEHLVE